MFLPTYLYIKEHSETGMKYFGKTTKSNPFSYLGSGKYWLKHISIHGKDKVITRWHRLFTDPGELTNFALNFSITNKIVESEDWANLCIENGLDGGRRENNHLKVLNSLPKTSEWKKKHGASLSGRKQLASSNAKRSKTQAGQHKGIPKPKTICRLTDKTEMSATGFSAWCRFNPLL